MYPLSLLRINSNQSVRIRSLENEISRLLAENIAYREQAITLQHTVDKKAVQAAQYSLDSLKTRLKSKLTELSGFIEELGCAQNNLGSIDFPGRDSVQQICSRRASIQKNWKNATSPPESSSDFEARLPPILEDKYYPRRTLE